MLSGPGRERGEAVKRRGSTRPTPERRNVTTQQTVLVVDATRGG